jgi:hypothetical protein
MSRGMEFVTSGSEHEGHRRHHTSLLEFQPSFRKIPHKTLCVDELELLDLPWNLSTVPTRAPRDSIDVR